jgi:hypothetical protein
MVYCEYLGMKADRYQILLMDSLDTGWSAYFSEMDITTRSAGLTRLCGEVVDQSALHGLLNKIRDLNLKIVSVQLLDSDGITPVACCHCPMKKKDDG